MSQKILVTGATGAVGSELVRLLGKADVDVRAGTRRPARAAELFGSGVEVVELDYARVVTFDAAVEWAERIFLISPPFDPHVYETLSPLLDWAVQAGVSHVVAMSAMGMEVREDLPIRKLERHILSLGVDWTFLRPNLLMQNFGFLAERMRRTGAFSMPVKDARVSLVDGRDVAAVAALALTTAAHMGKAYTLTGPEALTHAEVAETISKVAGRVVTFRQCNDEEMLGWLIGSGWRPEVAGAVIALYQAVRAGVREAVTSEVETLLGRPPISFRRFAEDHSDLWR